MPDASNAEFRQSTARDFHYRQIGSIVGYVPNKVVFVDSNSGSNNNNGLSPDQAKATLAGAFAVVGSNQGDAIYCFPGHSETLATAGETLSKSGVFVMSGGIARNRATFTCAAADVSGVTISGSNNWLHNLIFVGSTSQTGAATGLLSISGTDCIIRKCEFRHGGAGPLQAISLVAAHRTIFEECLWLGTSAGPDMGVKTTAAVCNDCRFSDCIFNYANVNVDSACIGSLAGGGYPGAIIERCLFLGANSSAVRNLGSYAATVPDGVIKDCMVTSNTGITMGAAMPFDCGGLALANCYWTDVVANIALWFANQQVALASNISKGPWGTGGPT